MKASNALRSAVPCGFGKVNPAGQSSVPGLYPLASQECQPGSTFPLVRCGADIIVAPQRPRQKKRLNASSARKRDRMPPPNPRKCRTFPRERRHFPKKPVRTQRGTRLGLMERSLETPL
jgi:hypothetical protein